MYGVESVFVDIHILYVFHNFTNTGCQFICAILVKLCK